MTPAAPAPTFSLFVCGLAWLTATALIGQGRYPRGWRSSRAWLCLTGGAVGLANWVQIAGNRLGSSAPLAELCAVLWGAASAALIEYTVRRYQQPRGWAPRRWVYLPLAIWTGLAASRLDRAWLPIGFEVVFAWGVVALAADAITTPSLRSGFWRFVTPVSLVGYSIAVCFQWPAPSAALALIAVVSFWRGRRAEFRQAETVSATGGRAMSGSRRWAAPAAFAVALGAGWFVFGAGSWAPWDESVAETPALEISNEQLFAELEGDGVAVPDDDIDRQIKRCGLAAAPIIGLVLAVWGLGACHLRGDRCIEILSRTLEASESRRWSVPPTV